ncbi:hypothetical protein [Salinicola endophyticus]|uniref:hypothetical protein n=1 Tax=Salinicola endophyticus TaxID=1949083 RepID=UPI00165FC8C9|nr:hypothetical protein [Salinicola endophyticus]
MQARSKSLFALAVTLTALSPLALAAPPEQPQPPAPHSAKPTHATALKDAVVASWSLDQQQQAALTRADTDFRDGLHKLRGDGPQAAPEQRRAALDALLDQQRQQLAKVLDPAQLRAYLMLERQAAMPRHPGPRRGHDPAALDADLKARFTPLFATWQLAPQQRAEVLNAQRTFFDGLHQLKRPDAAPDAEAGDPRGERFRRLIEQRHSALAQVLSRDQVTAFEALTQPPRPPHAGQPPAPDAPPAPPAPGTPSAPPAPDAPPAPGTPPAP